MSNEISQKSTAGRTVDYGNGTYSMYFYAGWTGDAFINVTLYVTREAVLFYNNFRHREKRILWSAVFSDGNVSEKSNCTTTNGGHWNNKCSYGNIWSLGKTVLLCEKPESLACGTLASTSQDIQNLEMLAEAAVTIVDKEYLFEGNYRDATFSACPIKVQIEDSRTELKLPTCGPDLPVAMTSGYWLNNITFVPMMCKSQKWTPQLRLNCTSDKSFFFIGDSTLLQLNRVFNRKDIMGEIVKTVCKFFGLRTGFPVQKVEEVAFESDFIDKINVSLCRSYTPVVVFNFGFHYASWSVRAYIDRIYRTKFSVIRLFERCPNSIVIIKLAHPRDNNSVTQSVHSGNYLFYDMNRMLRRVFGGIGVRFLDLWDMVLSHPDKNTVHVAAHIIQQQFDMLFSYICPSMVK
ncbi:NXPE family member 3-like [Ptychodera flava]|uniref:NXPE family member 3-like n=1 Tax=Ptychodera flava TaxID=63121 RepID=UPI00396AAA00